MIRLSLIAIVLAGSAMAQTAEVFIPQKDGAGGAGPEPTNRLAACLARPDASTCTGVSTEAGGVEFETATGQPTVTFETLVLDLNDGDSGGPAYGIATQPEPPSQPTDYSEPVPKTGTYALPSVAITIEFDFDKAAIRADQFGKMQAIVAALQDPALAGTAYAVIGHTDAAGSDYYNCDLSRRRAAEVTGALQSGYVTVPLYPVGFGEHVLKNLYDPRAAENRRVTFLRLPDDAGPVLSTAARVCGQY